MISKMLIIGGIPLAQQVRRLSALRIYSQVPTECTLNYQSDAKITLKVVLWLVNIGEHLLVPYTVAPILNVLKITSVLWYI